MGPCGLLTTNRMYLMRRDHIYSVTLATSSWWGFWFWLYLGAVHQPSTHAQNLFVHLHQIDAFFSIRAFLPTKNTTFYSIKSRIFCCPQNSFSRPPRSFNRSTLDASISPEVLIGSHGRSIYQPLSKEMVVTVASQFAPRDAHAPRLFPWLLTVPTLTTCSGGIRYAYLGAAGTVHQVALPTGVLQACLRKHLDLACHSNNQRPCP